MNIQQISFYERIKEVARSHSQAIALINEEEKILYGEIPEKIIKFVNVDEYLNLKKYNADKFIF